MKEKITLLLDGYSPELMMEDLLSLDPLERLKIVTGLVEFVVPKLQRSDIKADVNGKVFNIGYGERTEPDPD